MAISGNLTIRIRANTWRFRFRLSLVQLKLSWWQLRIAVRTQWRALWAWLRPGLAPELNCWWCSPWLSRTAGRPVLRSVPWSTLSKRMAEQARLTSEAFRSVGLLMEAARASMEGFAAAVANIRLPGGVK